MLTSLSYYHGGLSDVQLTTAIEKLELCDNGQEEYDIWVHDAPLLLPQFHQLAGINLKNKFPMRREGVPRAASGQRCH